MKLRIYIILSIVVWLLIVGFISEGDVFNIENMDKIETVLSIIFIWIPLLIILPYTITNIIKEKIAEINIKKQVNKLIILRKKILRLALEKSKNLSFEEIEINVDETDIDIKIVLDELISDGKIEKYINKNGGEMYRFNIVSSDNDREEFVLERSEE